jgi:adenylyltransferase/sulfurtransferase
MLSPKEHEHYKRHLLLPEIGEAGQLRLKSARVLMVGVGGLGCPAAQYLAAAGVGHITLLDFDRVDASNLQRQVLFGIADLGMPKAQAAAKRLRDLNPHIEIVALSEALTPQNALRLFEQHDLIIDGSDNFATRYLVNDAALLSGKPYVYGSVQKFEGQVSVFNYQGGPTYRCLFAEAPPAGAIPNCAEQGVLGVLPGIIGLFQAAEALKIILQKPGILNGKLMLYNALTCDQYTLDIARDEKRCAAVEQQRKNFDKQPFEHSICASVASVDAHEFIALLNTVSTPVLIDVREFDEAPIRPLGEIPVLHLPLSVLDTHLQEVPRHADIVVFCRSGIRSAKAIERFSRLNDVGTFKNLRGGLMALEPYLEQIKKLRKQEMI